MSKIFYFSNFWMIKIFILFIFFSKKLFSKNDFGKQIEIFRGFVENELNYKKIPSAVISIINYDQIIYEKIYTNDSLEKKIDEKTIFRVGSISKFFTSILFFSLLQREKFLYEEFITKYNPEFSNLKNIKFEKYKIKNILSHHFNLKERVFENYLCSEKELSKIDILSEIKKEKPREYKFAYQNVLFNFFLKNFLEKKFKTDIKDIFTKFFIKEFSLKIFCLDDKDFYESENIAEPFHFDKKNEKFIKVRKKNYKNILLAGSFSISLFDTKKIINTLFDDNSIFLNFFQKISKERVFTCGKNKKCRNKRCLCKKNFEMYYGYGSRIFKTKKYDVFFHQGALSGVRTLIAFIPSLKIAIVSYINTNDSDFIEKIFDKFINLFG